MFQRQKRATAVVVEDESAFRKHCREEFRGLSAEMQAALADAYEEIEAEARSRDATTGKFCQPPAVFAFPAEARVVVWRLFGLSDEIVLLR
jgi:hypothetical protein